MSTLSIKKRPCVTDMCLFSLYPNVIARILSHRGLKSLNEVALKLKYLLPPELKGLQEAVNLMNCAIDQQQKIVIIGDYDADGATSTALMMLCLRELQANVDYIVPDRFKYGYGLTPAISELAYEMYQPDVLITVDNGISSHEGVEVAQALGMKVVITDHHLTTKEAPLAETVVNPNQSGCEFPSKSLAGVGVAFYVLAALMSERKKQGKSFVSVTRYLDLVALGTYADVAGLDYNNRILIDAGLKRIQKGECRKGILALLELAQRPIDKLQAQDFGFVLGPRINAAGRMDNMKIGIECLLTEDWELAYQLAQQLNQLNMQRRQVENEMKQQALEVIQHVSVHDDVLPPALVMFDEMWHQGVIGIVAGRLKEVYHRPSIVFAPDINPELIKGSARSIEGIHIRDMIEQVAERKPYLVKYFGGHAAAAGLTIEKRYFDEFKTTFCDILAQYDDEVFQEVLWTDGELSPEEMNLSTLELINQFAPYGHKFPLPVFEGSFQVVSFRWLKERHLKLSLALENGRTVEAIAFSAKDKWMFDEENPTVFLVYELEKNEFNGRVNLQLMVKYLASV